MTVAFNKDYGIQEVVRSIAASSTTEKTPLSSFTIS
jgi:hypothetical protein